MNHSHLHNQSFVSKITSKAQSWFTPSRVGCAQVPVVAERFPELGLTRTWSRELLEWGLGGLYD